MNDKKLNKWLGIILMFMAGISIGIAFYHKSELWKFLYHFLYGLVIMALSAIFFKNSTSTE